MTAAPRSHPLLDELVNDSLDAGYRRAAARRHGSPAPHRRRDSAAVALGTALAGFLLTVGYLHAHRTAPEAQRVHDDLVARVRQAQSQVESLDARAASLDGTLAAARSSALPPNGALARRLSADEQAAGLLPVTGPGLVVTLREPPAPASSSPVGRAGTVPITSGNILTDRDLRSVVDELWLDGAEAVAVNGIRLTPTSAIRFAGQAVLVDFRSITSPYTIDAIGDAARLATRFAESDVASRYKTLSGVDGIGFTFADAAQLSLPAGAPQGLRYATAGRR